MRLIEQREMVIAPGAIVRVTKEAGRSIKDLMARWHVLGVEGEEVRVEDVDDPEDTRTFHVEQLERVSGGVEKLVSIIPDTDSDANLRYPEHDRWPVCIREEASLFDDPEFDEECLIDDPDGEIDVEVTE